MYVYHAIALHLLSISYNFYHTLLIYFFLCRNGRTNITFSGSFCLATTFSFQPVYDLLTPQSVYVTQTELINHFIYSVCIHFSSLSNSYSPRFCFAIALWDVVSMQLFLHTRISLHSGLIYSLAHTFFECSIIHMT